LHWSNVLWVLAASRCTPPPTSFAPSDTDTPGWRGYAASFDDFALKRDDVIPLRYQTA
jgi:hypothetical protein